jgi:non-ribosomal peptide synthetase component E (peptide arylation enzyme)
VVENGSGELGLDEITAHLAGTGLSKAKWPEFAFTVSELPQTTVGKLDRTGARRLAHDLHAGLPAQPGQHRARTEQHRQGDA